MTDLSHTSFIIHYRRDSQDREFNLFTILNFLLTTIKGCEIIIINDDVEVDNKLNEFRKHFSELGGKNIRYFFLENHGPFKKSFAFNIGRKESQKPVLCFYDVDVLIDPIALNVSQNLILLDNVDHVYPFNGNFINVKKTGIQEVLSKGKTISIEELKKMDKCHLELASPKSPGGCTMISAKAFDKINGYDERFLGWGFEDTDFYERSKKVNKVTYITEEEYVCWHLEHTNAIRTENPNYNNNLNIFVENRNK